MGRGEAGVVCIASPRLLRQRIQDCPRQHGPWRSQVYGHSADIVSVELVPEVKASPSMGIDQDPARWPVERSFGGVAAQVSQQLIQMPRPQGLLAVPLYQWVTIELDTPPPR